MQKLSAKKEFFKDSFRLKRPPILNSLLNSSGESTGGSSELEDTYTNASSTVSVRRRASSASVSSSYDGDSRRKSDEIYSPYATILDAMENDPKWLSEISTGRMVGLYRINGEIGTGNFAKVRLGVHQLLREKVAVKIIDKAKIEPKLEKMLAREVSCMESLFHPNIVRLYEVIETSNKLYLVSEWAAAGDLYSKVTLRTKLSETEAKPIFRQILSALMFMHNNGIIHRDLKAENIFFSTSTHCKLGDFGFATYYTKGKFLKTFCGSPPYAAPELFRDDKYEGSPVDIWALGVLLYFMVEGCLPFVGSSIPLLKKVILKGEYEISSTVSLECVDLIQRILQQKPRHRLNLSRILRHPWVQNNGMSDGSTSSLGDSTMDLQDVEDDVASDVGEDDDIRSNYREPLQRQNTTQLLSPATKLQVRSKCSIPTREQLIHGLLTPAEMNAFKLLFEIGISQEVIDKERAQGIRSHVVGIYKIILHRLQEGRCVNPKQFVYTPSETRINQIRGVPLPISPSKGVYYEKSVGSELELRSEAVQMSAACNIL